MLPALALAWAFRAHEWACCSARAHSLPLLLLAPTHPPVRLSQWIHTLGLAHHHRPRGRSSAALLLSQRKSRPTASTRPAP